MSGGQSLQLSPESCLVFSSTAGGSFKHPQPVGKLFDKSATRLVKTIQALGIKTVHIQHAGSNIQHVDLKGRPLAQAKRLFERESDE
jgi:hypothetical protein